MNKNYFKLGIIGNPLSHSISPILQDLALKNTNLAGSYEKFEVTLENLPELIEYFKNNNFAGFNVTIPYKIDILKFLDEIESSAEKIGAVNTVKIKDNKLFGYNTDIYGFVSSIPQDKRNIQNAKILGCGGAALAVVFGLEELGCKHITICARNKEKAMSFINTVSEKTNMSFEFEFINEVKTLENTDILVNTTPLGTLGENENKMAIDVDVIKTANKNILIYDLVYNPSMTKLLLTAKENELSYINGLDMLVLQGVKAFEIWTNIYPDAKVIKTELV